MSNNSIKSIKPLGFPWQTQDPFLFCVHHVDDYPKGNFSLGPAESLAGRNIGQDFAPNQKWRMYHGQRVPGFPAHPHYGFETVTIVTKGLVDHSDSLGAAGRFGFGDVQWMTAGKGVQHCEMFPLLNQDRDNPLELFQIWLNLPRDKKSANPHFAMLWGDSIPEFENEDHQGRSVKVKVIAGQIKNTKALDPAPDSWAANPANEVAVWLIKLSANAEWTLPLASSQANRSLYFYSGNSIQIDATEFNSFQCFELEANRPTTLINGAEESLLLLLQGKPIGEPVVQYGPFVVNKQSEVQQVMSEYQRTQFGGWPWSSYEHVHDRQRQRFALYPNGKEETRPLPQDH
ncbi:MAG: pirin family protein [Cyclobacteriaceae bacterium]|jgi:hypothetical protein|nr:pirin family protein [Cyclobacteriaceae bacterium]